MNGSGRTRRCQFGLIGTKTVDKHGYAGPLMQGLYRDRRIVDARGMELLRQRRLQTCSLSHGLSCIKPTLGHAQRQPS